MSEGETPLVEALVKKRAYKKAVQVPTIQEEIPIRESELLKIIQASWTGPGRVPDNASIYPNESGPGDQDDPVVVVQWDREPLPGEFEELAAKQKAEEDDDEEDDDEEDDDEEDRTVSKRCRNCRAPVGSRHSASCSLNQSLATRVSNRHCIVTHKKKAPMKKKPASR